MPSSRAAFREFLNAFRTRQLQKRLEQEDAAARGGEAPPAPADSDRKIKRRNYLWSYIRWLKPFFGPIGVVVGLAWITAAMSLVMPRATMYIIDQVLPAGDYRMLHLLGGGLLGILIVQQSLDLLRNWRTAVLNARVLFRLRQRLYAHLLRLPLHKLSAMKTGGLTSRLSGDVDAITGMIQMSLITPAVAGLKIILTITMLLLINWQMAVAAVMLMPLIVTLNVVYLRRVRPIYRSMRHDRGEIDGRVVETFGGVRVVRAFGREKSEERRYAQRHHAVIRKALLANWYEYLIGSGWGFVIPLVGLVIIWFGGSLALAGKATVGGIIAFQMYLMMLLVPVSSIVRSYGEMQQALAALERVFDLLETPIDKPDRPGALDAPDKIESFEFDAVGFRYPQGERVLHDFSLRVPGGATVALVGPSGAGKTTVTNLVARFYDPTDGAIRVNGVDLRDIRLERYRRLLGIVQQDVFLFDGTIAENIAYGRPDATTEAIEDAARRANVHDFVMKFEAGYDTLVGERGVRLSGGQAQRVSIARAILADPQILILDEATSNLDSESERLIQQSLRALLADRTTFIIAHRLSTIVSADLIVVMERGGVLECGTHEELLERDGRYRTMVALQQRGLSESAAWAAT